MEHHLHLHALHPRQPAPRPSQRAGPRSASRRRPRARGSNGSDGLQPRQPITWLWVKNMYPKWVALVSGNMDQNLWFPGGLILTHTHVGCRIAPNRNWAETQPALKNGKSPPSLWGNAQFFRGIWRVRIGRNSQAQDCRFPFSPRQTIPISLPGNTTFAVRVVFVRGPKCQTSRVQVYHSRD